MSNSYEPFFKTLINLFPEEERQKLPAFPSREEFEALEKRVMTNQKILDVLVTAIDQLAKIAKT